MNTLTLKDVERLINSANNINMILKKYADLSNYRYIDYTAGKVVTKSNCGTLVAYSYKEYEKIIQDLTKKYLHEIDIQQTILNCISVAELQYIINDIESIKEHCKEEGE